MVFLRSVGSKSSGIEEKMIFESMLKEKRAALITSYLIAYKYVTVADEM